MGALDGKVAVVTGGSRGIGKGAALELAEAGATVYVTARSVKEGDAPLPGTVAQTVQEVEALGGTGIAVGCDVRNDEALRDLFKRVDAEQKRLDVLVNSAFYDPGMDAAKPFWETPLSWYDDLNAAGTRGAYVATYFAAPLMVRQGSGLIANISSMGAVHHFLNTAYGMGKAALDKLTKDAGRELKPHGVATVSIWPYLVKTEGFLRAVDSGESRFGTDGAESQRFVGRGIVALASDPEIMKRSGKAFTSRELADEYGFTDLDGNLPDGSPTPQRNRR
jgi:NAD(P)-dependent dehydrogenase (short-subunit alcohol dehydrogenase family)